MKKTTVNDANEWGTGIVILLGAAAEAVMAFMYKSGDLLSPMIPAALVAGLTFLVGLIVNIAQHNGKSVLSSLVSGFAVCLVFYFTLYGIRGVGLVKEQFEKNSVVSEVTDRQSEYTKEFLMNGSGYYADAAYTKLYRIKQGGWFADYEVYDLYTADQLKTLNLNYSSFYSLIENTATESAYDDIAYAFLVDQESNEILIRIKNVSDAVLYAKVTIDNPTEFIAGMNLTSGRYVFDGASVYYLRAAEPFDIAEGSGAETAQPAEGSYTVYYTSEGVRSELTIGQGTVPFIVTVRGSTMYVSQVSYVTFDADYDFSTRVSVFENDFIQQRIAALEQRIAAKGITALQKTELRAKLKELKEEQESFSVEMVTEREQEFGLLRLYRIVTDTSYCASLPSVSVAEIKLPDGTYRYGRTNLNTEDLYIAIPLEKGGEEN